MNSLKNQLKHLHRMTKHKTSNETTNRFSVLLPDENPTDSMGKDSSLDGACERSIQIDDSNSNHRTTSCKKASKMPRKNKLPVTIILGDSIVKYVNGWKLSDEKNKVVVKHFSGAKKKTWNLILFPPSNKIQKQSSSTLGLTTWKAIALQKELQEILSTSKHLVKLKRIK